MNRSQVRRKQIVWWIQYVVVPLLVPLLGNLFAEVIFHH